LNSLPEENLGEDASVQAYLESIQEEANQEPQTEVEEEPGINREALKSALREIVETIVLTLIIFLLIQTVVRNFKVLGDSMQPNLHDGQYLIVDKISYRLSQPKRGDVIVFEPPTRPDEDYVKRVIGLPGEMVEVRDGTVYINGQPLSEPYIVYPATYSYAPRRVGPSELFVLGDNRNRSSDSHNWGMLSQDKVVGKAWVSYWPPKQWGLIPRDAPTASATVSSLLKGLAP
jgi:signal peptidase I